MARTHTVKTRDFCLIPCMPISLRVAVSQTKSFYLLTEVKSAVTLGRLDIYGGFCTNSLALGKGCNVTTVYDVPAEDLITQLTEYIKRDVREITPPDWAEYVKTGSHVEKAPLNPDWWYVRSASMLRKLYLKGPIGVSRLRKDYGGRKRRGVRPAHFSKAGGAIIRRILKQLEEAGLAVLSDKEGRRISPKGRSLLDALSGQIKRELDRKITEHKVY